MMQRNRFLGSNLHLETQTQDRAPLLPNALLNSINSHPMGVQPMQAKLSVLQASEIDTLGETIGT